MSGARICSSETFWLRNRLIKLIPNMVDKVLDPFEDSAFRIRSVSPNFATNVTEEQIDLWAENFARLNFGAVHF